jgi:cytochrome c oxidase subunit II
MNLLTVLAQSGPTFWLPDAGSATASEVDFVFQFIFWISAFFFALIVGLMVLFAVRYRRRKGYEPKPAPKSHNVVEIVWTVIPFLVVVAIFWVGFRAYLSISVPPDQSYEIRVTGQKWSWLFEYPNGWVDGELHVPVDRNVLLTLRSEDVIHSLWIPAFRMKMDVVPGRYNKAWFKATKIGEFPLLCTEYCGTGHSDMLTTVVVHPPGGYEDWLKKASNMLSPVFRPADLTDAAGLLRALKTGGAPVRVWLLERLAPETREKISAWPGGAVSEELRKVVVDDLNAVLTGDPIYDEARFAGVAVSEEARQLLAADPPPAGDDRIGLNRFLLVDAFPDALSRAPDLTEAGRYIYERKGGCRSCHSVDGGANVGPTFKGIWGKTHAMRQGPPVTVEENYIRESILDPNAKIVSGFDPVMPTYRGRLTDREIDAVIAFLKTLAEEK